MARWIEWTESQEAAWSKWVAERPQVIQDMVEKYKLRYDTLYRLKTTGQRVILYSLAESGTVTVNILYEYNPERLSLAFGGLQVFGIDPADLEECDLPTDVPCPVVVFPPIEIV